MSNELETTETTVEGAPVVTPEEPKPLPPVDQIEVFPWSTGHQRQAFTQHLKFRHLPLGALHYLSQETDEASGWVEEEFKQEAWTEEVATKVGLSLMECPVCEGTNRVAKPYRGKVTGIRVTMPAQCACILYRLYHTRWHNPGNVPADYRKVSMYNVEKYYKNFGTFPKGKEEHPGKFEGLLATVRKYQFNCYFMIGPAGTGKTTLMVAMYQRALQSWALQAFTAKTLTPAVWKISATVLSKQFREYELGLSREGDEFGTPTPIPEVTERKVIAAVKAGFKPCVFIDEFDKIKLNSEFQAKEFSLIIDAVQSNGGSVVVSSNIGLDSLKFALGEQFGPAIIRRLCGPRLNPDSPDADDPETGGFLVNFWRGTIEQNYQIEIPKVEGMQPQKPNFNATKYNESKSQTATTGSTSRMDLAEEKGPAFLPMPGATAGKSQGSIVMELGPKPKK